MRVFLMTLLLSIVITVAFWTFGLARLIWPAHPFLATTLVALGIGIAIQLSTTREQDKQRAQKLSKPPAR